MTAEPVAPGPVAGPVRVWRLALPWPAPLIRENDRGHWAAKGRVTKLVRETTHLLARSERLPRGLDRIGVTLVWQPGLRRHRDQNAGSPTLKAACDGLVDYGVVADDDIAHVAWMHCEVREARKGTPAGLWLDITEVDTPTRTEQTP